jgi:hypothetical protein
MSELTAIPALLDAGTACTVRLAPEDYLASEGWVLTFHAQGRAALHVAAAADGDEHVLELSAADTATLISGRYRWSVTAARVVGEDTEGPFPVAGGALLVRPDLATATAGSLENPDEKALRMIRAVLEGRITADVEAYSLPDGNAVTGTPIESLVKLEAKYRRRIYRRNHPGMFAGTANVSLRRATSSVGDPE